MSFKELEIINLPISIRHQNNESVWRKTETERITP